MHYKLLKWIVYLALFLLMQHYAYASDTVDIDGVSDILTGGESMIRYAARWGGIITVLGAALALGSGRLEGALAQTICKVVIVIALIIAAFSYFGQKISWGFDFNQSTNLYCKFQYQKK